MRQIIATKKRTVMWATVLLVMLIIVGGGMIWVIRYLNINNEEASEIMSVDEVQTTASGYGSNNDVDGGLGLYDEQIGARDDEREKQALLLGKSNFALSVKRNDDALKAAAEADRIGSDASTNRALALAYEAKGDKQNALIYYKKILEFIPEESDDLSNKYRPVILSKIKELEG